MSNNQAHNGQPYLRLNGVAKAFGANRELLAIRSATLDIARGEFLAIVGPSGCGKSTLLQIIAGLVSPSNGAVDLEGRPVTAPPPDMVYLFQQYAKSLFPWRTVEENVRFAFEHRLSLTRAEMHDRCLGFLAMVGLQDFGTHYPWQLSGGMQQRVAIARALAADPQVLLLDEPFSSVDALTRLDLHSLLLDLWSRQKFTVLLVTHDVDEAIFLADRVAMLTHRPSAIESVVETRLPRPRHPVETLRVPRYLELRQNLLETLLKRPKSADA